MRDMSFKLDKHRSFLNLLLNGENSQKKALLKTASDEQIRMLSEIVLNILGGVIPVSAKLRHDLIPHKDKLRKLGDKTQPNCVLKRNWNKFPLEILKNILKTTLTFIDRCCLEDNQSI